jgi:hypothetical protein
MPGENNLNGFQNKELGLMWTRHANANSARNWTKEGMYVTEFNFFTQIRKEKRKVPTQTPTELFEDYQNWSTQRRRVLVIRSSTLRRSIRLVRRVTTKEQNQSCFF